MYNNKSIAREGREYCKKYTYTPFSFSPMQLQSPVVGKSDESIALHKALIFILRKVLL
jgi:hypothetical protein